jgi:hypothetical protein
LVVQAGGSAAGAADPADGFSVLVMALLRQMGEV